MAGQSSSSGQNGTSAPTPASSNIPEAPAAPPAPAAAPGPATRPAPAVAPTPATRPAPAAAPAPATRPAPSAAPASRPRQSTASIANNSETPPASVRSRSSSSQMRRVDSCSLGEHNTNCGHQAVNHNGHLGYVNDDGDLDCKVGNEIVVHEYSKKRVVRMCDLSDEYERQEEFIDHRKPWYKDKDAARFICMFVLTGVYCIAETFYGLKIDSLGLIADAMHMLSDFVALIVGYYAMRAAKRHSTYSKTYGLKRMEIVASLMNATFMLAICLNMFMEAFGKFMEGYEQGNKLEQNVDTMLTVNYIGLGINFLGMIVFGHDGHGHSHGGGGGDHEHSHSGHSHSGDGEDHVDDRRWWQKIGPQNSNLRGILIHFVGDVLGSAAVAVSGLTIKYGKGNWRFYMDPMSAVFISVIICIGTWPLVKETARVLQQETPESIDLKELTKKILEVDGVEEIHELHVWTLTGSKVVASMHVLIRDAKAFMRISDQIKMLMHADGIHSSTIQPEVVKSGAQLEKVVNQSHTCHEPICSRSVCTASMCCPERREMIAKVADKHRKQQ